MNGYSPKELIDELFAIRLFLTTLLLVLTGVGIMLVSVFLYMRKRSQALVLNEESRAFQAEASGLHSNADYPTLKDIASAREPVHPGDAFSVYQLGMAHFRCQESPSPSLWILGY
jgi:hypothetical protein